MIACVRCSCPFYLYDVFSHDMECMIMDMTSVRLLKTSLSLEEGLRVPSLKV